VAAANRERVCDRAWSRIARRWEQLIKGALA